MGRTNWSCPWDTGPWDTAGFLLLRWWRHGNEPNIPVGMCVVAGPLHHPPRREPLFQRTPWGTCPETLLGVTAAFVLHFRGQGAVSQDRSSSNPILPTSSLSFRRYLIQRDLWEVLTEFIKEEIGGLGASRSRIPTSRPWILGIESRSFLFGVRLPNHCTRTRTRNGIAKRQIVAESDKVEVMEEESDSDREKGRWRYRKTEKERQRKRDRCLESWLKTGQSMA